MRILSRVLSVGLAFLIGGLTAASAGTVKIEQTGGRTIAVVAEGASVAEIVGKLGAAYGFRLDHKGGGKLVDPARDDQFGLDGRYEGSLRTVLERILDRESYFIEHAPQSQFGIARVVLYNISAPQGPVLTAGTPVPAAAVPRYVPAVPAPASAIVPPVRRVQPAQPSAGPARPNVVSKPARATASEQPTAAAASGAAPLGVAGQTPAAAGSAAAAQARKRGGVLQ
jgi:hypothetical protein